MKVTTLLFCCAVSSVLAAPKARGERPTYPYDPRTTAHCTWWLDNDGSFNCSDVPTNFHIELKDFLRWNPSITQECGNFLAETSYCVEARNEPAPEPTTTSVPTSEINIRAPTPTPVQPNIVKNCNTFYQVQPGDICRSISQKYGISLAQFLQWNPDVNQDCTGLWANYYVCVAITDVATTTTLPSATKTNDVTTPTPTQPGMAENCDAFHEVKMGDICASIASKYGITLEQFMSWNKEVKADCSGLWLGYYVCVSTIGHTAPTMSPSPTGRIATPTPIQPGMVGNCDQFHRVEPNEVCTQVIRRYGINVSQFFAWNPEVKECNGIWAGYYVCVSVVGFDNPTQSAMPTMTKIMLAS